MFKLVNISSKKLQIWKIIGLILFIITFPFLNYFLLKSGDEISIIVSQLSFSGQFLKNQYQTIIEANGLNKYIIGQILDYGFMIAYGILIVTFSIELYLKFIEMEVETQKQNQTKKKNLILIAKFFIILGVFASIFDGIENLFILLTLSKPENFPNWWAIVHSCFALLKWVFLTTTLLWNICGRIFTISKIKKNS